MSTTPVAAAPDSLSGWAYERWPGRTRRDLRERQYPRPGGILIAAELLDLCRAHPALRDVDGALDKTVLVARRRALGMQARRALHQRLRELPAELLAVRLPNPRRALATLPLADRTRNVLGRVLPLADAEADWCVRDYLTVTNFGAYCLLDLLAARQELGRPRLRVAAVAPGRASNSNAGDLTLRLERISALIAARGAVPAAELGALLVEAGLTSRPLSPKALVTLYRDAGVVQPFRVVKLQGVELAVTAAGITLVKSVVGTAMRCVSSWGLTNVQTVASRIRALTAAPLTPKIVGHLLRSLPRFRWLDEEHGWFSFDGEKSRLARAVRKIFAVAERVRLDELRLALSKGAHRFIEVPPTAVRRYLSELAGCQLEGEWVRGFNRGPAGLSTVERIMVTALEQAGRETGWDALKTALGSASIRVSSLCRIVGASPLFFKTSAGRVRLIGVRAACLTPA